MNKRFILSLLNIPGIGKKTVNYISTMVSSTELAFFNTDADADVNAKNIVDILKYCRSFNMRIKTPNTIDVVNAISKADNILDQCFKNKIETLSLADKELPTRLSSINDPCVFLYCKGKLDCLRNDNSIGIIGTRYPTAKGKNISRRLGYLFGSKGYPIVNGLAIGCDKYAHIGCIEANGTTVAVLPSGLNNIYPAANTALACSILEHNGCLISEYPPDAAPYNGSFIERDRIQSALSKVLIVVETDINGGSIHTVKFATEYHKTIFCFSSNENYFFSSHQTRGNRMLLNSNDVYPLENTNDIEFIASLV